MTTINATSPCSFPHASSACFATDFSRLSLPYISPKQAHEKQIGLLFTFTLAGDAGISIMAHHQRRSLWAETNPADRRAAHGRGRDRFHPHATMSIILMAAAIIGVISPSGNEIGPFLSVEQAGLTQLISNEKRTKIFAWYNMVGSFATATGALAGGWLAQILQSNGWTQLESYRLVLMGYATWRIFAFDFIYGVSSAIEVTHTTTEHKTYSRLASLAQSGFQTQRTLRAGCFCRRVDRAKHDRLLVSCKVRCGFGNAWQYLFRRECSRGNFRFAGCAACQ